MNSTLGFSSASAERFPPMVMFDVTNVCNAACTHCAHPIIKELPDYRATHLDPALHRIVIDEVCQYPETALRYTADGEPLLHPRLFDLLGYAREKCTNDISLTTNGERMTLDPAERLLDVGVSVIDISLDALTREAYETVRVGLDFGTVTANVKALAALRDRRGSSTKIMVSIVRQPGVEASVDQFVRVWEQVVDKVLVRELHTNVGMTWGRPVEPSPRQPCAYLWNRVVVGCTGVLKFCPIDWVHASDLQRVGETTIAALWQGEIYQAMRRGHLANDYSMAALKPCAPCMDWRVTPWTHGYDAVIHDLAGSS